MGRGLDGFFIVVLVRRHIAVQFSGPGRGPVSQSLGGFREGATPLPIPNRAVKPLSADGTWASRPWESRSPPIYLRCRDGTNSHGPAGRMPAGGDHAVFGQPSLRCEASLDWGADVGPGHRAHRL